MALVPIASARHPGMQAKFVVERVRLVDPDAAELRYIAVVSPGGMRIPMAGRVVRVDGRWKVTRDTFLALMASSGVTLDDL